MVTSFIITFREALEAALIVSIMMAYLGKIGRRDLYKFLYLGTGLGVFISILLGSLVLSVYGGLPSGADKILKCPTTPIGTSDQDCLDRNHRTGV
jgi:FTR1 family protein